MEAGQTLTQGQVSAGTDAEEAGHVTIAIPSAQMAVPLSARVLPGLSPEQLAVRVVLHHKEFLRKEDEWRYLGWFLRE